eukprot:521404_1
MTQQIKQYHEKVQELNRRCKELEQDKMNLKRAKHLESEMRNNMMKRDAMEESELMELKAQINEMNKRHSVAQKCIQSLEDTKKELMTTIDGLQDEIMEAKRMSDQHLKVSATEEQIEKMKMAKNIAQIKLRNVENEMKAKQIRNQKKLDAQQNIILRFKKQLLKLSEKAATLSSTRTLEIENEKLRKMAPFISRHYKDLYQLLLELENDVHDKFESHKDFDQFLTRLNRMKSHMEQIEHYFNKDIHFVSFAFE